MDAGTLHEVVSEVCPIDGVSIGDPEDKSTWIIHYSPEATQAEKDAATNVVANIDEILAQQTNVSSPEFDMGPSIKEILT